MKGQPTLTSQDIIAVAAVIGAVVSICGVIFAVCVWIVRGKDMVALKPQIDQIPLMNAAIADIRQDMGEIKGTMAVIPAMQADTRHNSDDIQDLKHRVRALEQFPRT